MTACGMHVGFVVYGIPANPHRDGRIRTDDFLLPKQQRLFCSMQRSAPDSRPEQRFLDRRSCSPLAASVGICEQRVRKTYEPRQACVTDALRVPLAAIAVGEDAIQRRNHMEGQYDLLGPAEKHIAKQLREGFEKSVGPLRELVEKVEKLAEVDWEAVLLDPKKKESAVSFTDVIGKFPQRVGDLSLVALIAEAMYAKEEAAA